MKKKQWILLVVALAVLLGGVFLINRDILHWETDFVYSLELNPDEYPEAFYHLDVKDLVLKPGTYTFTISGNLGAESGARSAVKIEDTDGEILLQKDFYGGTENTFELVIENHARQIGVQVLYAPASGEIGVDAIKISSEGILYKDSVLRHLTTTAFFVLVWAFLTFRIVFPDRYRKCFPKIAKPETEATILILLLLTVISCIPLFKLNYYYNGNDLTYHLLHIRGVAASLAAGHIPPRILLEWFQNYGHGSGFYYPNFFLQIPAVLILLGFSAIAAYKIFIFLCTFLSLAAIYSCVKKISGKLSAARVSAVLYAFAVYRLVDVFYRAAIGEVQAFVFLPIIILGLYEIYEGQPEKWPHFALGFTGLLMCHMISLAICGVFTLAFVLIRFKKTFGDRQVFMALLKSALITLALGAFFLLPMVEQMTTVKLAIDSVVAGDDAWAYYESFDKLFYFYTDWHSHDVFPGLILLILPVLRLIFVRKRSKEVVVADTLSLFGAAALIMCTNVFPWRYMLNILCRIQFAWRIMMIATACLCVSCAIYADAVCSAKWFTAAVVLGAAACGLPVIIVTCTSRMIPSTRYQYIMSDVTSIHCALYMPEKFIELDYAEENGDNVYSNASDYEVTQRKRKGLTFSFAYEVKDGGDDVYFSVPLTFYTGYQAELTAADGTVTELRPEADDVGIVRVYTGGVDSGTIFVHYEKTTIQIVSEIISLSALVFIIVMKLYKKKESR